MMGENSREWYDILGRFKDKASEFGNIYSRVLATQNAAEKNPELEREYKKLRDTGAGIRKKIEQITGAVDRGYAALKNTLGLDAVSNNLGALPLIPIAVAGTAVAIMTKYISDAVIYLNKVEQFEKLEQRYGADKATQIIQRIAPSGSLFGDIGKAVLPIAALGLAWFLFRDK